MSTRPSGLYKIVLNGVPYWCWYNAESRARGVGWSNPVVAMSDKRHLLLKRHTLPPDATLVNTLIWVPAAKRRLACLTKEMIEADGPAPLEQPPTEEEHP